MIKAGVPRQLLALAVARLSSGESHVVLLVTLNGIDHVLDNRTDVLRPWDEAPYRWVSRQVSGASPQWKVVDGHRPDAATAAMR